jgi:hypothetical protein
MKRVLILDLDNTIYPVSSIADHLFARLFKLTRTLAKLTGKPPKMQKKSLHAAPTSTWQMSLALATN